MPRNIVIVWWNFVAPMFPTWVWQVLAWMRGKRRVRNP
jgi:hypothetical protein